MLKDSPLSDGKSFSDGAADTGERATTSEVAVKALGVRLSALTPDSFPDAAMQADDHEAAAILTPQLPEESLSTDL